MPSKPVPRRQCWPMCANQTLKTPQLWILCSSWHPKTKPCLPRAEPGPCFSWWCAGVPVRGMGVFLLVSPCLCKGFSRSLATTHCPPYPPAALRCGGCGSQPWQDGGPRAHSPSSLSQAGELLPEALPTGSTAAAPRQVPGPLDACRALGQLPPWAVIIQ